MAKDSKNVKPSKKEVETKAKKEVEKAPVAKVKKEKEVKVIAEKEAPAESCGCAKKATKKK